MEIKLTVSEIEFFILTAALRRYEGYTPREKQMTEWLLLKIEEQKNTKHA